MRQTDQSFRALLNSRKELTKDMPTGTQGKLAEEGGCGVVGFAANVPVGGRHILEPSIQMHNRGNGKGGGIACTGLNHEQLGVDRETLKNNYILQIALLYPNCDWEIEEEFITPSFEVAHQTKIEPVVDWEALGIPVKPPDIVRYFIRANSDALQQFVEENGFTNMNKRDVEDEFVYQNSFRLNQKFYASLGDKRAFVLSHARNLLIFKIVGYAEQVVQY
ncbi:MAG: glutamate synthase, partial [Planctomycetes bacterium]|nr:glutamate synthase [Planctomycetota bacterium]